MRDSLTKSALLRRRRDLALYARVLPSLDLKRRQLATELASERRALGALLDRRRALAAVAASAVPMMANEEITLDNLVRVSDVRLQWTHALGVPLPSLESVQIHRARYSLLARPHWVDRVASDIEALARMDLEAAVRTERLRRLTTALDRSIQRVNLFNGVLIPQARDDIRRIGIALGDAERMAIVRAKIAKSRAPSSRREGESA